MGQLYDEDLEISKYALAKKHVYFVYDSTYLHNECIALTKYPRLYRIVIVSSSGHVLFAV